VGEAKAKDNNHFDNFAHYVTNIHHLRCICKPERSINNWPREERLEIELSMRLLYETYIRWRGGESGGNFR
jgi:hypothetical protein